MTKEEKDAYFAKINAASADDHKKMMELLHITSLRPGVNGNDPNAVITIQVENEIGMLPRCPCL